MPSKNSIKVYKEDSYFHVFNQGVEKRKIFEESQDYEKFLYYLEIYLSPSYLVHKKEPLLKLNLVKNNLSDQVSLIAFCLMPNHFHLLLHQKNKDGVSRLMKQIATAYSMYFNRKYERVGPLFQGIFKACQVETKDHLLHLTRYIHKNPLERSAYLKDFRWSSYQNYLKKENDPWVKPQLILDFLKETSPNLSYENFVEKDKEDLGKISLLLIDGD